MKKGNTRVYFLGFVLFVALFALGFITFFSVEQENIRTEGYLNSLGDFFSLGWIFQQTTPLIPLITLDIEEDIPAPGLKRYIVTAVADKPIGAFGDIIVSGPLYQVWPLGGVLQTEELKDVVVGIPTFFLESWVPLDTHLLIPENETLTILGSITELNDGSDPVGLGLTLAAGDPRVGVGTLSQSEGGALAINNNFFTNRREIVQIVIADGEQALFSGEICIQDGCVVFDEIPIPANAIECSETSDALCPEECLIENDYDCCVAAGNNWTDQCVIDVPPTLDEPCEFGDINNDGVIDGADIQIIDSQLGSTHCNGGNICTSENECDSGYFCPDTPISGLLAHWKFDEADLHESFIAHDETGVFNAVVHENTRTVIDSVLGRVASFDGVADKINVQSGTNFQLNNFTYTFWVNPDETHNRNIFEYHSGNTQIWVELHNNKIKILNWGVSSTPTLSSVSDIPVATWTHIGITHKANGDTEIYLNGVKDVNGSLPITWNRNPVTFQIGDKVFGNNNFFKGMLDDVRIYNRALNAADVGNIYAREKLGVCTLSIRGNKCEGADVNEDGEVNAVDVSLVEAHVPTLNCNGGNECVTTSDCQEGHYCPDTAIEGIMAHWKFDETNWLDSDVAEDSVGTYDLRAYNGAYTETNAIRGHVGTFDGNNDKLSIITPTTDFQLQDFTYSLWIKPLDTEFRNIIEYNGPHSQIWLDLRYSKLKFIDLRGGRLFSQSELPLNQWTHAVVTHNGEGVTAIYLNGQLDAEGLITLEYAENPTQFHIADKIFGRTDFYNGSLDDVRIYNRVLNAQEIQDLYDGVVTNRCIAVPVVGGGSSSGGGGRGGGGGGGGSSPVLFRAQADDLVELEESQDLREGGSGGGGRVQGNSIITDRFTITSELTLSERDNKIFITLENGEEIELGLDPDSLIASLQDSIGTDSITSVTLEAYKDSIAYKVATVRSGVKILFIIPTTAKILITTNAETGEIISEDLPWWAFLASGV
jgi:hypothetical protein